MTGKAYQARRVASRQRLRDKVHVLFDRVWQEGIMPREKAYREIADLLNRPTGRAHLGRLTPSQLERVRTWAKGVLRVARQKARHTLSVRADASKEGG